MIYSMSMGSKRKVYTLIGLLVFLLVGILFKNLQATPSPTKSVQGIQTEELPSPTDDTVIEILDGDTLRLGNGQKVRLIGINAPENGQPYYTQAKEKLASLVIGKQVTLKYDVGKTDVYDRVLAYVYLGDTFVNKEIVLDGAAVTETVPPNVQHVDELIAAQNEAKKACNGIWSGLCKPEETACIQISSINPKGEQKNDEWLQLINTCSEGTSLKGFLVKDSSASNSYTFKDASISAKAKVKLHSGCGTDTTTDIYWKCPEMRNFVWNNTGDHVYLYDSTGKLISEVGY